MFKKMFGDKKEKEKEKEKKEKKEEKKEKEKKLQRASTVANPERASDEVKKSKSKSSGDGSSKSSKEGSSSKSSKDGAKASKPRSSKPKKQERKGSLKRKKAKKLEVKVDIAKPIEYPCVPEIILEYHKLKPFLKPNEEWLVVELAEFECLVDNLEIVQIIAKHSKFFELDPPELWEEFFEFAEEVPSYDEVINYDVWQEFRDTRYPC